jgi:hypothetical protein
MSDESLSSPASLRSRSAILHEVAVAIRHYQSSSEAEADLVAAARLLCDDTRRRSLPIERAIVDVKTALLAEVPDLAPGDSLAATRARFIQLTIEEYYRS